MERLKYLLLAWGIPILIVLVVRAFTPDPNLARTDFVRQEFLPAQVWVEEKKGSKRSDYFELRIRNPRGEEFFHRDPDREPIQDLHARLPKHAVIEILYSPGVEGNVLLEIAPSDPNVPPPLAFESVMKKYATRRRVVYTVAAVWFGVANLLAFALWKINIDDTKAG